MTSLLLATIGYESATQPRVIEALVEARVELLIDVRAVAASRRAGFSKNLLAGGLNAAGIDYLHLKGLGTPKEGRDLARAGKASAMHAIFHEHMRTDTAMAALEQAVEESKGRRVCLLCLEADPHACHRSIVADMMRAKTGADVVHLHPVPPFL